MHDLGRRPSSSGARRALVLAATAWLGGSLAAGADTLAGRLIRHDGQPVVGAGVELDGGAASTSTDRDGRYRFDDLVAGPHRLRFELHDESLEITVELAPGAADLVTPVDWPPTWSEEIVVSVATGRSEPLLRVPQSVSRLSAEEIGRRAAGGQLPRLLQFSAGAEPTQSGLYDFNLNTRGFNSSLNRRLAVRLDGRDPSVPTFGAQEWGSLVLLDELESVELLHGPASSLYGANAVNGVLNLVTIRPRAGRGARLRLTAGELDTRNVEARWSSPVGGDWFVKAIGALRRSDDFSVSRTLGVEYSRPCPVPQAGATDCLPRELAAVDPGPVDLRLGSARLDFDRDGAPYVSLEAGTSRAAGPVIQSATTRVQALHVEHPWARAELAAGALTLRAAWNARRADPQVALASGARLPLRDENLQLEALGDWQVGSRGARLAAGGSFRREESDSEDPATGRQTVLSRAVESDRRALFALADVPVSASLRAVAAARWDAGELHPDRVSPRAALVWAPDPRASLRAGYGEGFQPPVVPELFARLALGPPVDLAALEAAVCGSRGLACGLVAAPVLLVGNESLAPERVRTFELGASAIVADEVWLTLDLHRSTNLDFITDPLPQLHPAFGRVNPAYGPWSAPPSVPAEARAAVEAAVRRAVPGLTNLADGSPAVVAFSFANVGRVDAAGADLAVDVRLDRRTRLGARYAWRDFEVRDGLPGLESMLLPNAPERHAALELAWIGERWNLALGGRWVDGFRWATGVFQGEVDEYVVADLAAGVELGTSWSLGLDVANLLDQRHWESFGGDLVGRRALLSLVWSWS